MKKSIIVFYHSVSAWYIIIILLQEINDERARDGKSRRKRDDADEKGISGER